MKTSIEQDQENNSLHRKLVIVNFKMEGCEFKNIDHLFSFLRNNRPGIQKSINLLEKENSRSRSNSSLDSEHSRQIWSRAVIVIHKTLQQYPKPHRESFLWRYMGYREAAIAAEDVAKENGIKPKTVYAHAYKIRDDLEPQFIARGWIPVPEKQIN